MRGGATVGAGGLPGIFLALPAVPEFPHTGIIGTAPAVFGDLRDRMQAWADENTLAPAMHTGGGDASTLGLKQMAREMLADRGWSQHWASFDRLVQGESSWNPNAKNP